MLRLLAILTLSLLLVPVVHADLDQPLTIEDHFPQWLVLREVEQHRLIRSAESWRARACASLSTTGDDEVNASEVIQIASTGLAMKARNRSVGEEYLSELPDSRLEAVIVQFAAEPYPLAHTLRGHLGLALEALDRPSFASSASIAKKRAVEAAIMDGDTWAEKRAIVAGIPELSLQVQGAAEANSYAQAVLGPKSLEDFAALDELLDFVSHYEERGVDARKFLVRPITEAVAGSGSLPPTPESGAEVQVLIVLARCASYDRSQGMMSMVRARLSEIAPADTEALSAADYWEACRLEATGYPAEALEMASALLQNDLNTKLDRRIAELGARCAKGLHQRDRARVFEAHLGRQNASTDRFSKRRTSSDSDGGSR